MGNIVQIALWLSWNNNCSLAMNFAETFCNHYIGFLSTESGRESGR